ncbi:hypothetical protein [Mucilaginibacter sp.]|uniref:hypothetical protein n=1 Tax=Mucilaginibacter sp. TaxID=1882438 RepID=UPI00284A4A30|nr:hypothetical protein [Mucilaginibacter sp.]MDR3693528.1 hypothetical protein [Mucilaginibacter sp.]
MPVAEVHKTKSNLKAWIDQLSDTNMLDGVRILNTGNTSWDDLTEYQKENINAGLDDIKHGRVMSSEEFWDQLKNG